MLYVILSNLVILALGVLCLTVYLVSVNSERIRGVGVALFALSAVGFVGAVLCSVLIKNIGAAAVICGETVAFLAILMISNAAGRSGRTSVLRLCLAPLWSMLVILSSYTVSVINGGSVTIMLLGIFAASILFFSPACDFYCLFRQMSIDGEIISQRIKRKKMRAENKKYKEKRRRLKNGKGRK